DLLSSVPSVAASHPGSGSHRPHDGSAADSLEICSRAQRSAGRVAEPREAALRVARPPELAASPRKRMSAAGVLVFMGKSSWASLHGQVPTRLAPARRYLYPMALRRVWGKKQRQ